MHIKYEKKEYIFHIFRDCFKDGKIYNCCVGQSVMKPVDDELFQRRKDIKKGGEEKMTTLICRL